jgi:hypothetical protein
MHVLLRHQQADQIPGLHAEAQLSYVLRPGPQARLLLPDALRRVRRPGYCLVPLGHLHQIDAMLDTGLVHAIGFACLGLIVGLAALWSP